ncbi:MAG: translation initiation factor IF-2 subunit alpha [Candidatus Jordarchaeum sp.]|uniref:translation initiation factor IF-2 subunit alpha n=1 Tax=Candidatus Jordarchaeum sp. TaxID=2823881 RepID=UPI0040499761
MIHLRKEYPEKGDLVIGTVTRIANHGAYVQLDEYDNKEGMIHISEIALSWVRNIRNFVRENQKVVAKALRINPQKGFIDLSLRRVTEQQKRQKIQEWKRAQKAEKLLEMAATKIGKTLDEAYTEVGWKLEDTYGSIYNGLELVSEKGSKTLENLGLKKEWIEIISEIAQTYVEPPKVNITRTIEMTCWKRAGIDAIKKAFREAINAIKDEETTVNIYTLGAPKYRIEITADDYKQAETTLEKIINTAKTSIESEGGTLEYTKS